jgi:hypothetical protein
MSDMTAIQPFDWSPIDASIKALGYSVAVDEDGDHRYTADGKIGFYIRPTKNSATDAVEALLMISMFTLEDILVDNKEARSLALNASNTISSFCTFCLSEDERSVIMSSYLPLANGFARSHLVQMVKEREAVVLEKGTKVLALMLK